MINPMNLEGKRILVTGASSGIGCETAILLSKLGAKIIAVSRNEEKLNHTIKRMDGDGHSYYSMDLANIQGIEGQFKRIIEEQGKLNGMFHCAGNVHLRPLKLCSYEFLHGDMLSSFYAFVELSRLFANKKYHNDSGSIVVMSSIASLKGDKGKVAYCAAKAAIDGAVRAIAVELADRNIRVNSIVASMIKTNMYEESLRLVGQEAFDKMMERQLLGAGETGDIANAVAFLLSDASKFITGSGMTVDGGYFA